VLGRASDIDEGIQRVRELDPDVVLVDVTVEGGLVTLRAICGAAPDAKVVALAVREAAAEIVEYAELGISGYVTRSASVDDLVEAIQSVVRGEIVCPGPLAATLVRRVEELAVERSASNGRDSSANGDNERLTQRELEVLQLIEQGRSNQEIADRLFIAVPTVKNHLHSIFTKLNVHRRSDAAALVRNDPVLRISALSEPLAD
jgi:DNA-binding NarL/FixJ family response regulator